MKDHEETTTRTDDPSQGSAYGTAAAAPPSHGCPPAEDRLSDVMCSKPWRPGARWQHGDPEYPCGKCLPCKMNRRRLWTGRLLLEAMTHEFTAFTTLTYDDKHLPDGGSLRLSDYQQFLKRLRKALAAEGRTLRYYFVGEYGDRGARPHYHACLFGVADLEHKLIQAHWPLGFAYTGECNIKTIQYNCSHIVKSIDRDKRTPAGCIPEFQRMSTHPGIGAPAMPEFARWLSTSAGADYIEQNKDVVDTFRVDGHHWALGRYLKRKLRERVGFAELGTPKEKLMQMAIEHFAEVTADPAAYEAKRRNHKLRAEQKLTRIRLRGSI